MKASRRSSLQRLLGLAALAAAPAWAQTQRPPSGKVLKIIVPLTPGTTPDTLARAIGPGVQTRLGIPCIVDNRAGASGMIGMGQVQKADDGATLMITPSTTLTLPLFYKNVGFDVLRSFTPVTQVCSTSFVLAVIPGVPADDVQQFIAWARGRPGLFYSSPGVGTHHHLCMELFKQATGVQLEHVPYKGAAGAVSDFLGGQVPAMFMPIQVAAPYRAAGRLKIMGGTLKARHPAFPDIPSLAEQGVKDYEVDPWYAAWAAPSMPAAMVESCRGAITAALGDADVRETLTKQGLIIKTGTPQELTRLATSESQLWERVVRGAGIQPQ
jgi:tripartite-type tricarboxylate transporter receptor subunit TctC